MTLCHLKILKILPQAACQLTQCVKAHSLANAGQVTCFRPTEATLPLWGTGQPTSLLLKPRLHRELRKFIKALRKTHTAAQLMRKEFGIKKD